MYESLSCSWSQVRPHCCVSVQTLWELIEVLYVRHVTSARATDNSTGQNRPITSCGDLCKAWPMSIRGTASKIINILIITSWS